MIAKTIKPLKVLLVEDEPVPMMIHRELLIGMGYIPDIAITGEQALSKVAAGFDVIFMDIGLPDMMGFEVVSEIRRREAERAEKNPAYIIVLTAYSIDDVRDECMAVGVNHISTKPVDEVTLAKLLESRLHKAE